jgi:hypothetical protein
MFRPSGLDVEAKGWQLLAESIAQGFTEALIADFGEDQISSRHFHRGRLV